jgi:hypothetical protein
MACKHLAASWRCHFTVVGLLVLQVCFTSGISTCLQASTAAVWPTLYCCCLAVQDWLRGQRVCIPARQL